MSNPGVHFDESMSKNCDLGCFDIFVIADQCNNNARADFSLEEQIFYLGLLLNSIELTSINPTDDKKAIENLVNKAHMYSHEKLKPIIENYKNLKTLKLYDQFNNNRLAPSNVCVSSLHVKYAMNTITTNQNTSMEETNINIASVAGGFPLGKVPIISQISEVEHAILFGAKEIDLVIDRGLTIDGDFKTLYINIHRIKTVCNKYKVKLKTILAVTELESFTLVYKAAMTAMMAGSDFISTSTGMEIENANLCYGVVMCQAIRNYYNISGFQVGFKVNGGIVQCEQALGWLMLVKDMMGQGWLNESCFRIGAFNELLENVIKKMSIALIKYYQFVITP